MKLISTIALGTAALFASIFVAGCGAVTGSGDLVTIEEDYGEFTRIEVEAAFDVEVRRGTGLEVAITVDDNVEEYLEVEVSGDTLRIGMEDGTSFMDTTREAVVTMPSLEGLVTSDAVTASISGFEGLPALRLELSDASELVGTDLVVGTLEVDVSDASKVRLSGSGESAELRVSDASELDLLDFTLMKVSIRLQDASSGTLSVTESLTADVSDASSLEYVGAPGVREFLDISDGSEVETLE